MDNFFIEIMYFVLGHALLITLLSLLCFFLLPKTKRSLPNYLFLLGIGFFSSIFGYLLLILITIYLRRLQPLASLKTKTDLPVDELTVGDFSFKKRMFGEGGLRGILYSNEVHLKLKEKAFNAISDFKNAQSFIMVKDNLSSQTDEVRILAHSLLTQIERKIFKNISNLKELLNQTSDKKTLARIHLNIANSYWDLIFFNVIEESLKEEVINLALENVEQSIMLHETPEAHFTAGRIYLKIEDLAKAKNNLENAYNTPYLKNRVIPYLAELYYNLRDFERVKQFLSDLDFTTDIKIAFVKELWSD